MAWRTGGSGHGCRPLPSPHPPPSPAFPSPAPPSLSRPRRHQPQPGRDLLTSPQHPRPSSSLPPRPATTDKDLFSEFYRKKLARRLLHATSASEDHEKGVLTRLKQQCGAQFTSKVWGRRCCRCCRAAPLACSLSLAQAAPARGPSRTTPPLHPQHAFPFFRIRSNQSCLSIPILQMEGMVNDLQLAKEREKAFEGEALSWRRAGGAKSWRRAGSRDSLAPRARVCALCGALPLPSPHPIMGC